MNELLVIKSKNGDWLSVWVYTQNYNNNMVLVKDKLLSVTQYNIKTGEIHKR